MEVMYTRLELGYYTVFQARQARVSMYNIFTHVLNIWHRSRDVPAGNLAGTAGTPTQVPPPQTLRWQAQRLRRTGSRMLRSGGPDDDVGVVDGGVVG